MLVGVVALVAAACSSDTATQVTVTVNGDSISVPSEIDAGVVEVTITGEIDAEFDVNFTKVTAGTNGQQFFSGILRVLRGGPFPDFFEGNAGVFAGPVPMSVTLEPGAYFVWTEAGGELLTIEAAVVPGKGKLSHTGQLGEVMTESIQAAMIVVRSRADVWGIAEGFHQKLDVHIHVPEGATPKDGPSAGAGMCMALVSALTDIPVKSDVAMTGEITLRGEILPIGGLKEKLLAAHRGGISKVLIPEENEKDLVEIPKNIKDKLTIIPVKWIDQVMQHALVHMPVPLAASKEQKTESKAAAKEPKSEDAARPH